MSADSSALRQKKKAKKTKKQSTAPSRQKHPDLRFRQAEPEVSSDDDDDREEDDDDEEEGQEQMASLDSHLQPVLEAVKAR